MQDTTSATASGTKHVPTLSPRTAEHAADLLTRLFRGLDGRVALRLWNGTLLKLGSGRETLADPPKAFTLVCRNPGAVCEMVLGRDPLRLAEVYFQDDVDIEGDFFAALGLKDHLRSIRISWRDRLGAMASALRLCLADRSATVRRTERASLYGRSVKNHSKIENRDAVAFHYDVSNAFYALWLDEAMVYSCAYFEQPDDDLGQAQRPKLDHVCRKLLLHAFWTSDAAGAHSSFTPQGTTACGLMALRSARISWLWHANALRRRACRIA